MSARTSRRPSRATRSRAARALLLVAVVLLGAACELRTDVDLTVEPDGSGEIEVAIALDEDGMDENPDLLAELDFSDLEATGWAVDGPDRDPDGFTRIRVRHRFGAPDEVAGLVSEIAGEDGPFQDFSVVREDGFAETRYRFVGVVDFAAGVEGLTDDPALAEALEADPVELIEERLGAAIDQVLRFQVAVRLPGDVESNAPTEATNAAVWRPSVLERETIELRAASSLRRSDRIIWLLVAGVAGSAAVLFVAIRIVWWRRSKRAVPSS